jgi:DNA polymerase III subunit delta'
MRFADVIDQARVKEKLVQTVSSGKIAHAQMLIGKNGQGPLPLALAYAQFIACTDRLANDSCGKCSACVKYAKLQHPDFHLFFPNNTTKDVTKHPSSSQFLKQWRKAVLSEPYLSLGDWLSSLDISNKQAILNVDDSAEIIKTTALKNYESEFRIVLIWLAEKMNADCANKILKVLEEPPPKTVFLLVAEDTELMLQTIISRVQPIHLHPLQEAEIKKSLIERFSLDEAQASRIAMLSNGDWRLASMIAQRGETVDIGTFFINWMRAAFALNVPEIIDLADALAAMPREEAKEVLITASSMLRKAALYGIMDAETSGMILGEIDEALAQMHQNANIKIILSESSFRIGEVLRQRQLT